MSERKVLTKYYPPDFDPSKITRTRGPKVVGPKTQTVRLMAPFSMKCMSSMTARLWGWMNEADKCLGTTCGEYIYKGRKFNASTLLLTPKDARKRWSCSRTIDHKI